MGKAIGHFPLELVIQILEMTFFTVSRTPDRRTLSACSRVCREWQQPAQSLLFRYVVFQLSRHPLSAIKRLFSSPRGKVLGSYLRSVDFRIGSSDQMSYPPEALPNILSYFPRLYELHLNSFVPELDNDIMERLRSMTEDNPGRYRLRCLKWFGPNARSPMMYQLLEIWPCIQFLYIGNPISCEPPPERPEFTLYEIGYIKPPTTEVLKWLIPQHSLRVMYLQDSDQNQDTLGLFNREGSYIRSFRLATYNLFSASLASRCSKLEEINIGILPRELTREMIDILPNTIEHLRVREDPESIESILALIGDLPQLRIVTLPIKARTMPGVSSLEIACMRKNVEIVYTSSARNVKDDPVMVSRFPRGRCVSNFRLMN